MIFKVPYVSTQDALNLSVKSRLPLAVCTWMSSPRRVEGTEARTGYFKGALKAACVSMSSPRQVKGTAAGTGCL